MTALPEEQPAGFADTGLRGDAVSPGEALLQSGSATAMSQPEPRIATRGHEH